MNPMARRMFELVEPIGVIPYAPGTIHRADRGISDDYQGPVESSGS